MRSLIIFSVLLTVAFGNGIPSNLNIRPVSSTAVRISWHQEFQPRLKGFTVHYHNGDTRTTEWLTKTIWDPRASDTIIDGLRSQGEYSFCVRAIMEGRVCSCSEMVHINIATGAVSSDRDQEQQRTHPQQQHGIGQQPHYPGQGQQSGGHPTGGIGLLEAGAVGGDYVQLRWRYDGPKPVKYLITYRGYQRYDVGGGRYEEKEIDIGAPIELDTDYYVVEGLRPDTTYTFEVTVIDQGGRPTSRPQSTRVTTKSYIL